MQGSNTSLSGLLKQNDQGRSLTCVHHERVSEQAPPPTRTPGRGRLAGGAVWIARDTPVHRHARAHALAADSDYPLVKELFSSAMRLTASHTYLYAGRPAQVHYFPASVTDSSSVRGGGIIASRPPPSIAVARDSPKPQEPYGRTSRGRLPRVRADRAWSVFRDALKWRTLQLSSAFELSFEVTGDA